jgi:hypothetical protein
MDKKKSTIDVLCTCCGAVLTADRATGEVVFTKKPDKKAFSFEEQMLRVQQEKETAEDRFRDAFQKEEGRKALVDKKFEEALKRKDELEDPIRPLDLD